jgi:hypothetical protein
MAREPLPREIRLRSAVAGSVAFALAVGGIAATMLWLLFTFPFGAAADIAKEATDIAAIQSLADACAAQSGATPAPGTAPTTVVPSARPTVTLPCPSGTSPVTPVP